MEIQSHFKKYQVEFVESLQEIFELASRKETYFVLDRTIYSLYRDGVGYL